MIIKISSRFVRGDSRYEKPFHLAVCDKHSKYTLEHQIVSYLSKRKNAVVINRLNCRVRRNSYSCWGIADVLVDGQWIRWYSIDILSPPKQVPKKEVEGIKAGMYFTASKSSRRWGDLATAVRTYNINDL
jgi:hypothetical protein